MEPVLRKIDLIVKKIKKRLGGQCLRSHRWNVRSKLVVRRKRASRERETEVALLSWALIVRRQFHS